MNKIKQFLLAKFLGLRVFEWLLIFMLLAWISEF